MFYGHLAKFFEGIAVKKLSAVEADSFCSNQHEFNGTKELVRILGKASSKVYFKTRYLYMTDGDDSFVEDMGNLTWYDARLKHKTRSEHRLYFNAGNLISEKAQEGDILFIALQKNKKLLTIVAKSDSTISRQLLILFGLEKENLKKFVLKNDKELMNEKLGFISKFILEKIGIFSEPEKSNNFEGFIDRFGFEFPDTRTFSKLARETFSEAEIIDNPDEVIIEWMEREEALFRALEKKIVESRINEGFKGDVDGFVRFALSILNRRKSRVGFALENHLEAIFLKNNIKFDRNPTTENRAKPDFIFPGIKEYNDQHYKDKLLTMLGVKSTCKDRWRQVLTEAEKIKNKHLFTLEPGISENQTSEMKAKAVKLVVPKQIQKTFLDRQKDVLMDLKSFIENVRSIQYG